MQSKTPDITIRVDTNEDPDTISTLWTSRTYRNRYNEITGAVIVAEKPITKVLGINHAVQLRDYLDRKINWYNSAYCQWGRRKAGK